MFQRHKSGEVKVIMLQRELKCYTTLILEPARASHRSACTEPASYNHHDHQKSDSNMKLADVMPSFLRVSACHKDRKTGPLLSLPKQNKTLVPGETGWMEMSRRTSARQSDCQPEVRNEASLQHIVMMHHFSGANIYTP